MLWVWGEAGNGAERGRDRDFQNLTMGKPSKNKRRVSISLASMFGGGSNNRASGGGGESTNEESSEDHRRRDDSRERGGKRRRKKDRRGQQDRRQERDRRYSSDDDGDGNSSLSSSEDEDDDDDSFSEVRSRSPRRRNHRGSPHRRERRRRGAGIRRRESASSFSDRDDGGGSLTHEELHDLPPKILRRRCRRLGLDASLAVDKFDLVDMLHNRYRASANTGIGSAAAYGRDTSSLMTETSDVSSFGGPRSVSAAYSETDQMVEVLQEILPFFGQGDGASDALVRTTIGQLSPYALEVPDNAGNTILMLACQFGAAELVPALLARGCDVNARNGDGVTTLHFACYTDSFSPDTARLLLKYGARSEVAEKRYGCTPLHWAAFSGDLGLCHLLCGAGARPDTLDRNGCDPIAYARQSHGQDCVEFLLHVLGGGSAGDRGERGTARSTVSGLSASTDLDREDDPVSDWEEILDDSTGHVYFHNAATGESLWEDDYRAYRRSKVPPSRVDVWAKSSIPKKPPTPASQKPPTPKGPPPPSAMNKTPLVRNGVLFKDTLGPVPEEGREEPSIDVAKKVESKNIADDPPIGTLINKDTLKVQGGKGIKEKPIIEDPILLQKEKVGDGGFSIQKISRWKCAKGISEGGHPNESAAAVAHLRAASRCSTNAKVHQYSI